MYLAHLLQVNYTLLGSGKMGKRKTNVGIEGLNALDIEKATEGADLQEKSSKKEGVENLKNNKTPQGKKNLTVSMPNILYERFSTAKNEGKHFGSFSSYLFGALKEQLDKDGFN